MTKEEVIKKAWGMYFEHFGEHETKHALNNWGYCSVPNLTLGLILRRYGEDWIEVNKELKVRPKSLQGIETNNNWIKIESESDLPKDDILYWVIRDNEIIDMEVWEISLLFHNGRNITHYQPIIKPKPPLF